MSEIDGLLTRLKADTSSPTPQTVTRGSKTTDSLLELLNVRAQSSPKAQRAVSSFTLAERSSSSTLPLRQLSSTTVPSAGEPPTSTQKYLLDLFTSPASKPSSKDTVVLDETQPPDPLLSERDPSDLAGLVAAQRTPKSGRFDYVNPFDQLHASSPLNTSKDVRISVPQHGTETDVQPKTAVKPLPVATPLDTASVISKGKIQKETVPTTVADKLVAVGQQVDAQADRALARAETHDDDAAESEQPADDDKIGAEQDDVVEVYNLPMKPFVSLTLNSESEPRTLPRSTVEQITPVARFRKDFSHDDRCLATATSTYIAYGVPPTDKKRASGLKLIRQEDGKNKHLWPHENERISSVQLSSQDRNVVLATGINGTIYFANIPASYDFESDTANIDSLTIPPPNSEEPAQPTDVLPVRSRVKLGNLKPTQYFAAARGRTLYLLSPKLLRNFAPDGRNVDTAKYMNEYSITINIGKACKDFCFSEDDTVIASIDKLGRARFWDIRSLTTAIEQGSTSRHQVKDSLYLLPQSATSQKAESKYSPSNILFLDKERAHLGKIALRYVLLGFQQGRILQLWDLGLGKCVQELHLPEHAGDVDNNSEESQGACSITYHPKSCIIVVGHPGRNSVYLIHLSAPKYDLTPLSQAAYLTALANGDSKTVPKPESTAIMSGFREYSLSQVGQMRSLDILKSPFRTEDTAADDEALFEIYLVHSRGVVGIPVSRQELGWDAKGRLLQPTDAVEKGVVIVSEIQDSATVFEPVRSLSTTKAVSKTATLKPTSVQLASTSASTKSLPPLPPATTAAPKKASSTTPPKPASPTISVLPKPKTPSNIGDDAPSNGSVSSKTTVTSHSPANQAASISKTESNQGPTQNGLSHTRHPAEESSLAEQFAQLYRRLENDRRVYEAAAAAKQDAILRLVASTLTDNVEISLERIVASKLREDVLPALKSEIDSSLASHVAALVQNTLPELIRGYLFESLPDLTRGTLRTVLLDPHTQQQYAMSLASELASSVQKVTEDIKQQVSQSTLMIVERLKEGLSKATDLSEVSRRIVESEARITALLKEVKQEQARLKETLSTVPSSADASRDAPNTAESEEIQRLSGLLRDGKFEQAFIEWLQSPKQAELFDLLFVRIDPTYLRQVSALVALSIGAAVTSSLESNVEKRLEWLASVVGNIDVKDQEIVEVAPKILDVLTQRLQGAYMQLSEAHPAVDPNVLRKLAAFTRQISATRKKFD